MFTTLIDVILISSEIEPSLNFTMHKGIFFISKILH